MQQASIDPSVRGPRRTLGFSLMIGGGSLFVLQILYLLVKNYNDGLRPPMPLILGIGVAFIVWFIGKTLLKSHGTTSDPDA